MLPWFGYGDKVRVILELKAVKELEPLAPAASVLVLGRTCCALFTASLPSESRAMRLLLTVGEQS